MTEHDKFLRERAESEKYKTWMGEVAKRLPDLAQRTFALRGRMYMGCGFHYSLEQSLGRVISIANAYEGGAFSPNRTKRYSIRVVNEVIVEGFIEQLEQAECSARELAAKK